MSRRIHAGAIRRRKAQLAEARRNPIEFVRYVGQDLDPHFELAKVHEDWLEMWWHTSESMLHSSIGLGKSTLARLFCAWLLGDPEEFILWVGATQKQPRSQLGAIAAMIESPGYRARLHHIFPEMRPGRIWRSTELAHANAPFGINDPSLSAYGAFADSLLGTRATTVVFDDLCTWGNTLTADGRQKMIEWLNTVFTRLTKDRLRVMALGNVWHKDDAYHDMVRTRGFAHSIVPAYTLDDDGNRIPTAPQCLDLKKIARLERTLGPINSARMLQCRTVSVEVGRFRDAWFQAALEEGRRLGIRFRPDRSLGACFTGVDLGHKKKIGSDLTSMVTCMVLADGRRAIIDIRSGTWHTGEIRENLREIWLRYKPIIGVESNGAQGMVADLLGEALAIPLVHRNTGIEKWHYINGVEGLANELAQGFWVLPGPASAPSMTAQGLVEPGEMPTAWSLEAKTAAQPHAEVRELIDESLTFDPAKHTGDRLMAWWICAETLRMSAVGALAGEQLSADLGQAWDLLAR